MRIFIYVATLVMVNLLSVLTLKPWNLMEVVYRYNVQGRLFVLVETVSSCNFDSLLVLRSRERFLLCTKEKEKEKKREGKREGGREKRERKRKREKERKRKRRRKRKKERGREKVKEREKEKERQTSCLIQEFIIQS